MQKVEGSSPFIRFARRPATCGPSVFSDTAREPASYSGGRAEDGVASKLIAEPLCPGHLAGMSGRLGRRVDDVANDASERSVVLAEEFRFVPEGCRRGLEVGITAVVALAGIRAERV